MVIKVIFVASLTYFAFGNCAKLLRTPKIYNALITTDENLTPSRAYPVIEPVIQPAIPVLSPLYPRGIFEPYNSFPNEVNGNRRQFKNDFEKKSEEPESVPEGSTNFETEQQQTGSRKLSASKQQPEKPEGGKSPIPLNEFGLPPSLVPLQKYQHTYPYSFPYIVDSYGNYQFAQQYPVLPPLTFYNPQQEQNLPPIDQQMFQVGRKFTQEPVIEEKPQNINENVVSFVPNDAIKNYAGKNIEIPDVPLPPLPFAMKKN